MNISMQAVRCRHHTRVHRVWQMVAMAVEHRDSAPMGAVRRGESKATDRNGTKLE